MLCDRPADLERLCALTPVSRQTYGQCRQPAVGDDGELEAAWRVWVRLTQGRGALTDQHAGWRFVRGGTQRMSVARYLDGYLARIAPAADRLRTVAIEHRPATAVIESYDQPETLFYVDPPYLSATRNRRMYQVEMGDEPSHRHLLNMLNQVKGSVILSGYRSQLYDEMLPGWRRFDMAGVCMTGEPRTESVWTNFSPARHNQEAIF